MDAEYGETQPLDTGDVFAMYGTVMFEVQMFEYALKQLVGLFEPELPKDTPFEKAWRRTEKLLRTAAGPLKVQLDQQGKAPGELRERVGQLLKLRNFLAHEYLLNYVLERNADLTSPEKAVEELERFGAVFSSVRDELGVLSDGLLRELGVDPYEPALSDEEARRLLAEVETGREK